MFDIKLALLNLAFIVKTFVKMTLLQPFKAMGLVEINDGGNPRDTLWQHGGKWLIEKYSKFFKLEWRPVDGYGKALRQMARIYSDGRKTERQYEALKRAGLDLETLDVKQFIKQYKIGKKIEKESK